MLNQLANLLGKLSAEVIEESKNRPNVSYTLKLIPRDQQWDHKPLSQKSEKRIVMEIDFSKN